jgi:hypothetical protein
VALDLITEHIMDVLPSYQQEHADGTRPLSISAAIRGEFMREDTTASLRSEPEVYTPVPQ